MSKMSGRGKFTAILSLLTIGAALTFGVATAIAGDDVTEDQILKALAPAKKPLTRGLSAGPKVDPAGAAEQGQFVQKIRCRPRPSPSVTPRDEIATLGQ